VSLEKVVYTMKLTSTAISKGSVALSGRPWLTFNAIKEGGKFDLSAIREIFSRTELDTAYAEAVGNVEAKEKTVHALKLSADFLAGMERDYRMRQRSRIRMFTHAAAITKTNGLDTGPLIRNTNHWLQRINSEDAV